MIRFVKKCFLLLAFVMCASVVCAQETQYLPIERRMLFNAWPLFSSGDFFNVNWTHEGSSYVLGTLVQPGRRALLYGTNHFHSASWALIDCRAGTPAFIGQSIPPASYVSAPTNYQACLRNTLNAQILTPLYTNGIGTIYFDAVNVTTNTEITVE